MIICYHEYMNIHDASCSLQFERERMVTEQIIRRGVRSASVLNAFREIPRHLFIPEKYVDEAYHDHPLPIGYGQTISQPYIVALMTDSLKLTGEEKILEVGTGSGYQAAILSCLATEVHTVERIPELAKKAENILRQLDIRNVRVHVADGTEGWKDASPFDAIVVTAAAPEVPQPLLDQLAADGRLIIPKGSRWHQELQLWIKTKEGVQTESIIPVVFVPLIGKWGWDEKPPRNADL